MEQLEFFYGVSTYVMAHTKKEAVNILNEIFDTNDIGKDEVLSPSQRVSPSSDDYKALKAVEDFNELDRICETMSSLKIAKLLDKERREVFAAIREMRADLAKFGVEKGCSCNTYSVEQGQVVNGYELDERSTTILITRYLSLDNEAIQRVTDEWHKYRSFNQEVFKVQVKKACSEE